MSFEEAIPTVRFGDDDREAQRLIAEAADVLLASKRENPRLRIVAAGTTLPAPTISALISALRKLRERGGAIELRAERDVVAAIIRLNGLEQVFAFPLAADETERRRADRPRKRGGIDKAFRAAAAALAFLVTVPALTPAQAQGRGQTQAQGQPNDESATADTVTDPAAILAHVMERNPKLSSYQSRLHVDLRLISFPYIGQHLDGATYFKRPANYEVVFDRVPAYAKGFEKLYSDVGDPANWEQRFVITYAGQSSFENRSDIELHMVQRVRGMIDHETVLIDPNAWTIDRIRYDYYNGGVVTMTQHFALVDGYTMLSAQTAEIKIPHVRAVANGTYTDYRTNVAIADSVFTKKY